jgi:hypothetical protein
MRNSGLAPLCDEQQCPAGPARTTATGQLRAVRAALAEASMKRNDLLTLIQDDGRAVVEQFLPQDAAAGLLGILRARREEVNSNEFLMFSAIRELLQRGGMASCESDQEAGQIMALLKA